MVRQGVGLLLAGSLAGCMGYNPGYTTVNGIRTVNVAPNATMATGRFSAQDVAQRRPYTVAASPTRTELPAARAEQATGDGVRQPPAQGQELKPFTEEWWAQERAIDARLRAKIDICRGC